MDSVRKTLIRDDDHGRSQEALTLRTMLRDSARTARSLRMMIGTQLKKPRFGGVFLFPRQGFLQGRVILPVTCGHTFIAPGDAASLYLGVGDITG